MNQQTIAVEKKKQGWISRLVTAVFDKLFSGFVAHDLGLSPYELQSFMYYSSFGWEEAMMCEAIVRMKVDEDAS